MKRNQNWHLLESDSNAPRASYELLAPLGTGGMATVHLARMVEDGGSTRPVAVKQLHSFISEDPQNVAILVDEARLAASIKHPNVVDVVDLIEDEEGSPAIVMEWVSGTNLATLNAALNKAGRRLPLDVAVAIVCDVLAGLDAAHEARRDGRALEIVHRDVSPQNVLVGFDGCTRITDFGVAKAAWRSQQTEAGAIKGKLGYMAPEQLEGRCDRRSDIYGAAAVLWEMLTGTRFRPADGLGAQVLVQILYGVVDAPSAHEPNVACLDEIVMRALARQADDRFATAREMADALAAQVAPASRERVAAFVKELVGEPIEALEQTETRPTQLSSTRSAPLRRRSSVTLRHAARPRRRIAA
jgi:serine/threonine-protein kinase